MSRRPHIRKMVRPTPPACHRRAEVRTRLRIRAGRPSRFNRRDSSMSSISGMFA